MSGNVEVRRHGGEPVARRVASPGAVVLGVALAACSCRSSSATTPIAQQQTQTPELVDAGDFYRSEGRNVPLLRVARELVVRLDPATDAESFARNVTSSEGPLAGFERTALVDETTIRFEDSSGRDVPGAAIFDRLRGTAGVVWAAPVFFSDESGTRLYVTDEIVVALRAGTDPAQLFGKDFTSYRRLPGTPDQYIATVGAGAGVPALAAANRLDSSPGVAWASPNFIQDFRTQRQE